jgi:hypothetical protein
VPTTETFQHWLFLKSLDLVKAPWTEIGWIADELMKGRIMSYPAFLRTIHRRFREMRLKCKIDLLTPPDQEQQ